MSSMPKVPGEWLLDGIRCPVRNPERAVRKVQASMWRADDIFIPTFPKSGTHWIKDMISLIINRNNLEETNSIPVNLRAPFIDSDMSEKGQGLIIDKFDDMASPRVFSSHVRYHVYKENIEKSQCRVISVMRNPKDVLVSYYHFHRASENFGCYKGSWDDFFHHRMIEEGFWGSWFDHVLGYLLQNKNNPNYLFVKYEDFIIDCEKELKQVAAFLQLKISDEVLQKVTKMCSFQEIKKKSEANLSGNKVYHQEISPFYRKGKVGDWKNYFTIAQNERFDKIYEEKRKDTGLEFKFEI